MSSFRIFLLVLLPVGALGLLGTFAGSSSSQHPGGPAAQDPTPAALLDQALAEFSPERVQWLQTEVWQQVQLGQDDWQTHGHVFQAPGGRSRLELHTQVQSVQATLLTVCDGSVLWEAVRTCREGGASGTATGPWSRVRRINLEELGQREEILKLLSRRETGGQQVAPLGLTSGGIWALLHQLRQNTTWSNYQAVRRGEHNLHKLMGTCGTSEGESLVAQPCQCRLYLDLQTLWPHRLEWWDEKAERCLVALELRNPRWQHPLSAAECRERFTFQPGATPVTDQTESMRAWLSGETSLVKEREERAVSRSLFR